MEEEEELRGGGRGGCFRSDRSERRGKAQSDWRKDGVRKSMAKDH